MADDKKKRQEWKIAFDLLDADKSGAISPKELKIALKGLGLRPTEDEVKAIIREFDGDGSGELEFPEFCDIMSAKEKEINISETFGTDGQYRKKKTKRKKNFHLSEERVDETRRVFNSFDQDGSGGIDSEELKEALKSLGFEKTDEEIEAIMKTYDVDSTGSLSYPQFMTFVTSESEQLYGLSDKFKIATQNILQELSKTNFTVAAPVNLDDETDWENQPIRAPGRGGLSPETTARGAMWSLLAWQVMCLVLFGACCQVTLTAHNFTNLYVFYDGVIIMMLFGFGYLMTFLKRYGMGAVGFTMMITVLCIQWGLLVESFFHQLYFIEDHHWHFVDINLLTLMDSLFLVAAILISYGGVIGKTSPFQLIVMAFFESIFYSINKRLLCLGVVDFVDAGGTINIHMFGAYFGLTVSWMLGKPSSSAEAEGGHVSDLFSLIGTLFLWIYWPSFNAGPLEADGPGQQRAVVNTIISLVGATTATFFMSTVMSHSSKFRPIDIQNATIAGGVAIGAVCDLTLNPSDALLIGIAAGMLSTFGYNKVLNFLEEKIGLHDTCGIHNLHGMPSLLGGTASVILAAIKATKRHDVPSPFHNKHQALDQFIAIVFTLAVSISSGFLVGGLLILIRPDENSLEFYCDEPYWDVMDDFGRSIESTTQKMAKGLEHLQQGLEASAALRGIMSNFSALDFKAAKAPRQEKRGNLDSSVHNFYEAPV